MANFNIDSNIGDVTSSFGSFSSLLSGGVTSAISTVNAGLLTLAANPIGAVLAVIGVVIVAITAGLSKLQPVVDRIDQAMAALGATFSFFVDTVGSWLGLGDAPALSLRETALAAVELEKQSQAAADSQIALIVTSAELRAEQRQASLESADVTLATEDRINALERAEVATRSLFDAQRTQLDREISILAQQQALGNNTREDNEELARLQADRINLNAMEASQLRAFTAQRTGLVLREEMAAANALKATQAMSAARQKAADAQTARDLKEQEAADAAAAKEVDRIRELRQQREIDLEIAGGATEEEVFQLRLDRAETQDEMDQIIHERAVSRIEERREAEATAEEARLAAIAKQEEAEAQAAADQMALDEMATQLAIEQDQRTFDNLISLLGAGSVAGRAIALTQATISGIEGVQNAFTTASASPITALFPAYPFVQAGIAGAFSGVQIASILNVPSPPGLAATGGGGAPSGPTVRTPAAPSFDMNMPTGINSSAMAPMPAVVVSGDITDDRERTARVMRRTRLRP